MYRSKDEMATDVARRTGRVPYEVEVRDGGDIVARDLGGTETTVGTWRKVSGGFAPPSYHATRTREETR